MYIILAFEGNVNNYLVASSFLYRRYLRRGGLVTFSTTSTATIHSKGLTTNSRIKAIKGFLLKRLIQRMPRTKEYTL
jgi:hypothetical protein